MASAEKQAFIEKSKTFWNPGKTQAWLEGYRRIRPVSAAEENELWTFIMLRRMTLFAWIGSHAATELARTEGRAYSLHTCELAERYLGRFA